MKVLKKGLVLSFVLGVAGFILYQGTRGLETSLSISDQIVNRLLAWMLDDPLLVSEAYYEWYPFMNYLIRKMAHFLEYALFGCLFALYFNGKKEKRLDVFVYSLLPVLIVAIFDEFFQSYVGRGSLVSDVMIDGAGGLFGIGLLLVFVENKNIFKRKTLRLVQK